MEERKKIALQEIHDHIERAYDIAMTELDIKEKDEIQRKTDIQLEDVLRPTERALLKVLGMYELSTFQELRKMERLYDENDLDAIDSYEEELNAAIENRKKFPSIFK